jgi:hypothetical protein
MRSVVRSAEAWSGQASHPQITDPQYYLKFQIPTGLASKCSFQARSFPFPFSLIQRLPVPLHADGQRNGGKQHDLPELQDDVFETIALQQDTADDP